MQAVFLRAHSDILIENEEEEGGMGLGKDLMNLSKVQNQESERIRELIAGTLGTLGFVRETM